MAANFRTFFALRSRLATFKALTWSERRAYYPGRLRRRLAAFLRLPVWLLCLPAALVLNRLGWRIVVWSGAGHRRIGHLALEPHWYVKGQLVGAIPRYKNIVLAPRHRVANQALLDHWRPFFTVVQNRVLVALLTLLSWVPVARVMLTPKEATVAWENGRRQHGTVAVEEVFERYSDIHESSPLLTLDPELATKGRVVLQALGVPGDAWFVTMHVREHGYLADHRHDHRDCDVLDFLPAAARIRQRGGWVVRVGDTTMRRLPDQPGLIDYVFSACRSDWMDLFLLARCRFFLGSDSGPAVVPPLFGIPAAIVGTMPMGHGSYFRDDIYIPKLYRDKHSGQLLTFPQVLGSSLRDLHAADQVAASGVVPVDNTPEEIVELVDEMLDRCDSRVVYAKSDEERQVAWRQHLISHATEYTNGTRGRIGRLFVERYEPLLTPHT